MRREGIALGVIAADQLTKALAQGLLAPGEGHALIPGVLGLRYAENTGIAFSLFQGQGWLLGLGAGAVLALAWALLRRYRLGKWAGAGAMLMLGGAVGNLIDRLCRGYVVDMVEVLLFPFAIFNLADVALTVGAALLGFTLLCMPKEWSEKEHGRARDETH